MAQSLTKLNADNDARYDWRVNHDAIRTCILTTLKEEKRFPTYKEISVATGLSVQSICAHAKSLDMQELRSKARLLAEDILLKQAVRALSTGDHNEAKTYFKLNFDWKETTGLDVSGIVKHEVGVKFLDLPPAERAIVLQKASAGEVYIAADGTIEPVQDATFEDEPPENVLTLIHENGESES